MPDMDHGHVSGLWLAAIHAWVHWARAGGAATTTLYTRRQHLEHLARHLGNPDPWAVTPVELVTWCAAQAWRPETRRGHRATFRAFYGWAVETGQMTASPASGLPRVAPTRPNPSPAPDWVIREALAGASPRERLIIRLAVEAGLRRAEIAQVRASDIIPDLAGCSLRVHGKGGRERVVPLTDGLVAAIRRAGAGWTFPGDDGGHLSPRWVGTLIARRMPPGWTLHKLRHRAACDWHDASGGDLAAVQDLLGHADPKTTRAYVAVRPGRLRDVVEAAARIRSA